MASRCRPMEIHGVGALLLGFYDGTKLIYAGRTGTSSPSRRTACCATSSTSYAKRRCPSSSFPLRLDVAPYG